MAKENTNLEIHLSTQQSTLNKEAIKFFKKEGVSRVVLARETSKDEIKKIKDEVDIELECFIHGAMCYCYSGQCLFSSILGGRSGNRGCCAQPCRLPYELYENRDKVCDGYLMSPKDVETLEILPQLIEAGINSYKIEGRMKNPENVAGVTSI